MQEIPLEDLHKRLEILFSEFFASDETGPFGRPLSLRKFGDYPPGWVWEVDSEGKILWCSREVEEILGYKSDDLVGQPLQILAHSTRAIEQIQEALEKSEHIFNLQIDGKRHDGNPIPLMINALYRGGESMLQSGYRGVVQIIKREAPSRQEVVTGMLQYQQAIAAKPTPPIAATWGPVPGYRFQGGRLTALNFEGEAEIPSEAGVEDRTLRVPILNQQGMAFGALEFDRRPDDPSWSEDEVELAIAITQQLALALQDVRSYQLTQQALEEMQEADRLKTQFLANVSHELRTPLNSIIGFSRVILKGIDGPVTDTQRQDLSAIYNAGQHLLGLINNILDFSKIESGRMELSFSEIDLFDMIRSVVATANGLIKDKPVELALQLPEKLPAVRADSIRLRQVLLNLVSNAVKFTDQGQIGISAQMKQDGSRREVLISVSDTGPGISLEDQKKLFEPFSQLDSSQTRKTGGSGLGLSICRHLVELHGGKIWVESTLGQGSTFHFTLPLQLKEAAQITEEKPRVLGFFVDPIKQQSVGNLIQGLGVIYHPVSNLDHLIKEITAVQPNMILIDPSISEGLGWRSLYRMREISATHLIPIKAIAFSDDLQASTNLGVATFLIQPIQTDALESTCRFLIPEVKKDNSILIIDDIIENRQHTQDLLQPLTQATVQTASSGFEGLVATRQQRPSLILLNLFMANAAGFRMVEALRIDDRTKDIPVVLLFPTELADVHLRQLHLWTNHCLEKAGSPIRPAISVLVRTILPEPQPSGKSGLSEARHAP